MSSSPSLRRRMPLPSLPEHVLGLRCLICGTTHAPDEQAYVCPKHGNEGVLDVVYDYDFMRERIRHDLASTAEPGMWRFKSLLPLPATASVPALQVGGTPLYRAQRLARDLRLAELWIKDEGRQPTGSLKDRASALAVAMAGSAGIRTIATASTGNAAAALAGMCAASDAKPVIFVPATVLPAKIAQLLVYGAKVVLVDGSYDDAFELCLSASAHFGWYNRSTGYNPFMTEGKKTVAYEIVEHLANENEAVDAVIVPVGDGCILGAVHKGFRDMQALGWVHRIPRLIGVQAAGSDYLYRVWKEGGDVVTAPPIRTSGIADSLMAGLPRDRIKAMAAVRSTDGAFTRVSDAEILAAIPGLARGSGVFAEPAAAAAYAGLLRALDEGLIRRGERVAIISTGTGLKDFASAIKSVAHESGAVVRCSPNLESLQQAWT
ncbi:threonine synthase [Noviherbaspirillum agri]